MADGAWLLLTGVCGRRKQKGRRQIDASTDIDANREEKEAASILRRSEADLGWELRENKPRPDARCINIPDGGIRILDIWNLEQGGCFPCCTKGVFKGLFTPSKIESKPKTSKRRMTNIKVIFRIGTVWTSLKPSLLTGREIINSRESEHFLSLQPVNM